MFYIDLELLRKQLEELELSRRSAIQSVAYQERDFAEGFTSIVHLADLRRKLVVTQLAINDLSIQILKVNYSVAARLGYLAKIAP